MSVLHVIKHVSHVTKHVSDRTCDGSKQGMFHISGAGGKEVLRAQRAAQTAACTGCAAGAKQGVTTRH
eukprot:279331-Rhodomonas_salina.3